mmetsp:Transcript_23534/g.35743  ORF Transcript_23534/g.35743 Transcript_23534/m.35743 type:complete len:466 (+) Transcript_23534:166-1563(+)
MLLGVNDFGGGATTTSSSIDWIVISNFMVDADFLLDEVPELVSCPKILFFYEHGTPRPWLNAEFIRITPKEQPSVISASSNNNPTANPLRYQHRYGSHHTKMFLIGFKDRLRVIIHTANLLAVDIHKKTQGAYIQDFPFKSEEEKAGSSSLKNSCCFEDTLISYMESYGYNRTHDWSNSSSHEQEKITLQHQLSRYDYAKAKVVLIPSIPGYYNVPDKCMSQGYLKLKSAIAQNATAKIGPSGKLVCQFSSIGSLSEKWLREFSSSLMIPDAKCSSTDGKSKEKLEDLLQLVYPTAEEIRLSIEGYLGGNSVPGKKKNVEKSFLKPLYCKWSSSDKGSVRNPIHKKENVPHIKSYYQLTNDGSAMEWFVMGSHNLSKAAWGEIINGRYGKCLKVQSWELSVLATQNLAGGRLVPFKQNNHHGRNGDVIIPLPYSLHPERYSSIDEPWAVDLSYKEKDKFGRCFAG